MLTHEFKTEGYAGNLFKNWFRSFPTTWVPDYGSLIRRPITGIESRRLITGIYQVVDLFVFTHHYQGVIFMETITKYNQPRKSNLEKARKSRNRRRWIKTGLLVVGVGVGAYFGVSRGMKPISSELKRIGDSNRDLLDFHESTYSQAMDDREINRDAINRAVRDGRDFKYYPGIGVRFNDVKDNV